MLLPRESPGRDNKEAENIRAQLTDAHYESANVKDILRQLVPVRSMQLEKDTACVKDQLWRSEIALQPDIKPTLTTPKPTVTIGWKSQVFKSRFKEAYKSLQAFISPIAGFRSLAWPIITVEAREDGGSMRAARLQNLHNGAVMLSNLFELEQKCGNEEAFFNKVHVIGVELPAESVQLSCYWACRNDIGVVEYFGKRLQCWSLFDETGGSLRNAQRGICNVLEWIKPRTFEWIQSDMAAFEIKNEQILPPRITPAHTLASQYGVSKRRRTRVSTAKSQSSLSPSYISKLFRSNPRKRARES